MEGGAVSLQSESGEGRALEPVNGEYQIYTADDLKEFAVIVNGTDSTPADSDADARLMNDIDLTSVCGENIDGDPVSWTPIGTSSSNPYRGTFDGNGHTISGLYINSTADDQGLFGYVSSSGKVQNLSVSGSVSGNNYVGGVVGDNRGSVENCYNTGTVSGPDSGTSNYVGGVVGYNSGSVENCYNTGSVTSSGSPVGGVVGFNISIGNVKNCHNIGEVSGNRYVGGVVGENSGSVTNSYNTGSVSGPDSVNGETTVNVGGVVGSNSFSTSVTNCYNTGKVSGPNSGSGSYVGGVVGQSFSASVTNCYNTGKVSGPDSGSGSYVGGVVGNNSFATVTDCYFLQGTAGSGIGVNEGSGGATPVDNLDELCQKFANVTDTWSIHHVLGRPVLNENKEGGDGSPDSPYEISTATQLKNFATAVNDGSEKSAHAKLMNNINLNPGMTYDDDGQLSNPDDLTTWGLIGTSSNEYTGTFDGNGKTIKNLYVKNTDGYGAQGLFGYLGSGGTVQNLTVTGSVTSNVTESKVGGVVGQNDGGSITDCAFSGSVSGGSYTYVGGIVGQNRGSVEDCDFTGSVSGNDYVGGVVGYNSGPVKNCYNTGSVSVTGSYYVGGVVGYNNGGTVENCYNTGTVTGTDDYVGGVVGDNGGTVENCYNIGEVSGNQVGGVVGYNGGTVENCYNTGTVTGTDDYVGGVVGYNINSVTNCYNTGSVSGPNSGSDNNVGGVVGYNSSSGNVTGCYFLQGTAESGIGENEGSGDATATAKDNTAFHSGEVAYLLQGTQTTPVWGQSNLKDKNSWPTLVALNPGAAQPVYKVTFKYGYDSVPENEISYTNGSVKFPTFERTGYTFAGWTPTGTTISQDTTFTAQWTANTYTVTLHTNDGTIAEGEKLTSYTYGVGAKLPAENKITKTGHTFAGWYNNADLTGDPVIEISATDTGEKEYWAKWTPNTYQVTLHTNDGTIAEGQNVTSYIYGVGAKLPTENEITKTGYIFAGWYNNADLTGDPVTEISKTDINDKAYWAKWEEVENPEPEPTPDPTPTPDPEPSGPSTGDSTGWDDILDELENTAKGDEITIDMGDETKVPAEIFESLAGKDVDVTFDLGDIQWSVNGADIPTDTDFTDLDLGASLGTHGIPVNVINTITGEVGTVQMTLAHDGEFGFTMTLTAPLGKENAGYWANLYHYDESAEAMNFEAAAKIDEDGSVTIPFSHASQYAIVIDTHSHATVDVSDLFIDIAPDAWYKDAIQYAYDNGLMTGTSANEFAPEATTTRVMIVSILARLENVTTAQAAGFADVDDEWYATAVNWAANVGVVNGYEDNTFRPNTAITREQLAAILMNYAAYKGEDVSNRADLTSYTDQPSTWAEEAMSWAVAEELISGVTADTLQPQGAATRAQVAAILQRFLSE